MVIGGLDMTGSGYPILNEARTQRQGVQLPLAGRAVA